jgi:aryl-alcohol dehydrogenase-like predicted oxidoreductase
MGASLAALAIAWCISNPNVTTAIVGATRKEQLLENFKALDVLPALTPAVLKEIEEILQNKPLLGYAVADQLCRGLKITYPQGYERDPQQC